MRNHLLRLLLLLVVPTSNALSQADRLLNYSIVGSASSDKSPSYGKAIVRIEVQRLLLDLAASPRTVAYVDTALTSSPVSRADLEELRLTRREGDQCFLNFTLFTAADVKKVRAVSELYAPSLAAQFLSRRNEIDSLLRTYDAHGVDPKAVAFIVLGCASLDWGGLAVTAEEGYREATSTRPDGEYVPYAEERTSMNYQRIYWGSHNDQYGDVKLTSFGDHFSPRRGFPDFFWSREKATPDSGLPTMLKASTPGGRQVKEETAAQQLGSIMFALRDSDRSADELVRITQMSAADIDAWLRLLTGMEYVAETSGLYRATTPVFTKRDREMIRQLRNIGRGIMTSWLKENYSKIKVELSTTAPTRNGVPYEEGFTMIWHFLFGMANDQLVRAGLFADPYAQERTHRGYIPVVFDADAM
jgi:hypothetical protein